MVSILDILDTYPGRMWMCVGNQSKPNAAMEQLDLHKLQDCCIVRARADDDALYGTSEYDAVIDEIT